MRSARVLILSLLVGAAGTAYADLVPVKPNQGNLYEAGIDGSKLLKSYPKGTWLEILAEQAGWIKVRTPDGTVGYVRVNTVDNTQRKPGTLGDATTTPTPAGTDTRPPSGGGASAGAPKAVTASSDAGKADFASKVLGKGSADQSAAAGKGFSEEVERGYRNQHPDLEPLYAQIDHELLTMNFNHPEVLEKFRRQGSLGEFAPAGK